MKPLPDHLRLSATDLANHLGCRHLTALDLSAARGELERPMWKDPALEVLQQRGLEHERAYLDHLRERGREIVDLQRHDSNAGAGAAEPDADLTSAFDRTVAAMRAGADVIAQATLASGRWLGRADVLLRVGRPSGLGAWSYEVVDTKLARETRAGTVLQLCLYSDVVREIQGSSPETMHVVAPGRGFVPESFRVRDFLAYYRLVRRRLEAFVDAPAGGRAGETYPDPVPQCDICRWRPACNRTRRADDHLSLVAGISKLQRRELATWGVGKLEELARMTVPLARRPQRGSPEGYTRVREQARVQLERRQRGEPVHELLLPVESGRGLARLPAPSPGDIFFDIEGDAFAEDGGLEYLLGWAVANEGSELAYHHRWGLDRAGEKAAFEAFVDFVMELWSRVPDLHIYHYTPYDPGALKRLMGRYGSREDEVDRMLRAKLFVDLYGVVRQSLRASVERYSIKELEVFYSFEREAGLDDASLHRRALERALELGAPEGISEESRRVVEVYNRDDCVSTRRLRDWLETLRAAVVRRGQPIERPAPASTEPTEDVDARSRRVRALMARLLGDLPAERSAWSDEHRARWLLAHLLDWHRREHRAPWWEYFRLCDLSDEELLDERAALSGLELAARVGGTARCPVDRYRYPRQDTDVREEGELHIPGGRPFGTVKAIDQGRRLVDITKRKDTAEEHPGAVFAHSIVRTQILSDALLRLGEWVAGNGVDAGGFCRAGRDLLLRRPPRLGGGTGCAPREGEETLAAAQRLALDLDGGTLPIQGPPGSGKTYTGARMICALVRAGKRVGITAVSHKVIRNLLDEVVNAAAEAGLEVRCVQKVREKSGVESPAIREVTGANQGILDALARGEAQVAAGTAWVWAAEDFSESVDVLFVDEAGQMALANVLAVAQAARSIVLLGDPQQLEQPLQGSHPEGTDVSALEHVLSGGKTIPAERGLFLPETWRLHPGICAFTSELFYEGRLEPRPRLDRQILEGGNPWSGAGLWFAPVEHEGNQSSSPEEVERVGRLVDSLLAGVSWSDREDRRRALTLDDILIVAPYNAQVADLTESLPEGARVGTVDRFQGQEAPVVIYSMTTSSPEEAPRGMEFLYSLNRLNVATSRARCACILVASPRLFEPECHTPRQMRLANAFCRYLELAREA